MGCIATLCDENVCVYLVVLCVIVTLKVFYYNVFLVSVIESL